MNDLGMTLAWSAIQVTLVLVPAAVLHALASRRSAASGSWMATVGLAFSVAVGASSLIPWHRSDGIAPAAATTVEVSARATHAKRGENTDGLIHNGASAVENPGRLAVNLSWAFDGLRGVWRRIGPATTLPTDRVRPWGSALAVAGIAGAAIGLLRLVLGLAAVELCRRRGSIVSDALSIGLCEEIRRAVGCRQEVEIREVPELTTPATAGWRRPVIMLPDDWKSWDDAGRRAVLAHELAHIHRWDYAAGLVARLALALEFYHPLAHWMARRLQLQQELAADAMGARFAGGRGLYLLTLSRLALKQDGRSPGWPARAFLPARGTLIRRIAMLQDESRTPDRPWSRSRRLLAGLCLLVATLGVAMLRGPARGDENEKRPDAVKGDAPDSKVAGDANTTPFDLRFASDETEAIIAFRPAATFRRTGMPAFTTLTQYFGLDVSDLPKQLKIDPSAPGRLQLGLEDIDWVISGLHFGRGGKAPDGQERQSMLFSRLTVRTTKAFDWLRFLREWCLDLGDAHYKGQAYFKICGHLKPLLGTNPCVYLPDDRTIVFDEETKIQEMLSREKPVVPAYLAGKDWEPFSRGILAVAINNRDGMFTKSYDLGRPDDAIVRSLFKGVDRWMLGVADADAIALHATADCRDESSETIAHSVESLVKMAHDALEDPKTVEAPIYKHALRMAKTFLTNFRVGHDGRSIDLHSENFGTLTELGPLVEGVLKQQAEDDAKFRRQANTEHGQLP
jgi:beta-lactamase regulating signal transducer with metallopeptidase domain